MLIFQSSKFRKINQDDNFKVAELVQENSVKNYSILHENQLCYHFFRYRKYFLKLGQKIKTLLTVSINIFY